MCDLGVAGGVTTKKEEVSSSYRLKSRWLEVLSKHEIIRPQISTKEQPRDTKVYFGGQD